MQRLTTCTVLRNGEADQLGPSARSRPPRRPLPRFRDWNQLNPTFATYLFPPLASALAVALMIASEVTVAPLVASIPFTLCLATIFRGTSVNAE